MNDDGDIPSIFTNNQATDAAPLFTCALKLDKYDYDKKVRNIYFSIVIKCTEIILCI